jgi:hypothetical protein
MRVIKLITRGARAATALRLDYSTEALSLSLHRSRNEHHSISSLGVIIIEPALNGDALLMKQR